MPLIDVIWDLSDDPEGNVQHIAEHGLTSADVEHVLDNPERREISRSSGQSMVFGYTPSGEYITVVFEEIDQTTIYPITAYPLHD